jgi:cobaltochelatase CobN
MHRIAALPGGWEPNLEGVIFVEQSPAPIIFLTAKDTDIQTLSIAHQNFPENFPELRAVNLLQLQQQLTIDTYADQVLAQASIIVLRLLGGRAYWSYGLEVVRDLADRLGIHLLVLPGDDRPDPDLISHSTVPLGICDRTWHYFNEGGVENVKHAFLNLADQFLGTHYQPPNPQPIAPWGVYQPTKIVSDCPIQGQVGIIFYRAYYQAANLGAIDALCQSLADRGLGTTAIYVSSLQDPDIQSAIQAEFINRSVDLLLVSTGFSIAKPTQTLGTNEHQILWQRLNVPVLQIVFSSGTYEQWQGNQQGLAPRDMAMHIALPEVDGRVTTRVVACKSVQARDPVLETETIALEPIPDRLNFVADLAANWVQLRRTTPSDRNVAIVLANYPNRDGRLANGVGLDTPQSCVEFLFALADAGYDVGDRALLPQTGDELIDCLTRGITNDPEGWTLRKVHQSLSIHDYQAWFSTLPNSVQTAINQRWGLITDPQAIDSDFVPRIPVNGQPEIPIAGLQFGKIFVGIQPSRGYDRDPLLNYHAPDLEPTHDYLAFYEWLRSHFRAQAIIHFGKHGNLEWLPGKGIALSESCFPEVALGALPNFYPFIVNDPGEGSQAKRRSQAVILDHLTPPLTRAELYGNLSTIERLIDEYYEAQSLDPQRTKAIAQKLVEQIQADRLDRDLSFKLTTQFSTIDAAAIEDVIAALDGYLCELKEAQIRDGLHIFGRCPDGEQLRDLAVAIARSTHAKNPGITRAIARDWHLSFDPLTVDWGDLLDPTDQIPALKTCRTLGDAIEQIEAIASQKIAEIMQTGTWESIGPNTDRSLAWVRDSLLPALRQTPQEIDYLLRGLNGEFVPAGPSGAPSRGRADVLPTGRNFYSVDLRSLPTETAWDVGRKAAETVVERYVQENGDYPTTLGLSVWGTSTMRTGGDDIAEALALLGVRPVWDGAARRVVGVEVLPVAAIGRPRVDVTLRISGFFRDAFPNLIDLVDRAVYLVAALDEAPADNPIAQRVRQETQAWQERGLDLPQAIARSHYRIFGSKPGAYGAGLQGLIEAQNWHSDADLARAYLNWSSYAYSCAAPPGTDRAGDAPSNQLAVPVGHAAPEAFEQRLREMQIVLHNQDNHEHDLLDSDDYYQFQGGLTAAVRAISGQQPTIYFGDNSQPDRPRTRALAEEIARVYRSRVVNPKWIASAMRHGYKGAFEMSATMDYLFAYDATTHCVEDFMYQGVAEAYLLDRTVQDFIRSKNPWALRDMAERLLEANQRGLWQQVDPQLLDQLRAIVLEAEADIESR